MSNKEIAHIFRTLAQLMELHGENSFKYKAYSNAAFQIEKLAYPLADTDRAQIQIPGVGAAISQKIDTILHQGSLPQLQEYLKKTPAGVRDMLQIKGIGPKKIGLLWQELQIESIGELAYACQENRLTSLKGFGAKTQANVLKNIQFLQANQGRFLYATVSEWAESIYKELQISFNDNIIAFTGDYRRQSPVLTSVDLITDVPLSLLSEHFTARYPTDFEPTENGIQLSITGFPPFNIYVSETALLPETLFQTTGSPAFLELFFARYSLPDQPRSEQAIFEQNGLAYLPPALRENQWHLTCAETHSVPELLPPTAVKGIIHCHSTYSDGMDSLEAMALAAKEKGYEYLVITDHSKSAFYANGLQPERIRIQHAAIDDLNRQLAPFKIFKGIESDILNDGSLDYDPEILALFDIVIASVHSNLKMSKEKAMARILRAIENPYTTILGHPTGRLLLSREGYPVDHEALISACATHQVVLEINAHPRRLDLDWQWIPTAIRQGVLLSVNPDAHSIAGMDLIRYGILAAQKGGLTASGNLSSFSLPELEHYLQSRKNNLGQG